MTDKEKEVLPALQAWKEKGFPPATEMTPEEVLAIVGELTQLEMEAKRQISKERRKKNRDK